MAKRIRIKETELYKSGPGFKAANGSAIAHYGQRTIDGIGDQYQPVNITAQVANAKSTLGSVHQMLKAGNRVHFETGNCFIEQISTGMRTKIVERNGTFEVGVWVPRRRVRMDSQPNEPQSGQGVIRQDGE